MVALASTAVRAMVVLAMVVLASTAVSRSYLPWQVRRARLRRHGHDAPRHRRVARRCVAGLCLALLAHLGRFGIRSGRGGGAGRRGHGHDFPNTVLYRRVSRVCRVSHTCFIYYEREGRISKRKTRSLRLPSGRLVASLGVRARYRTKVGAARACAIGISLIRYRLSAIESLWTLELVWRSHDTVTRACAAKHK